MKHSDFNRRASLINFLDEVSKPKAKSRTSGQLFYSLVFAGILAYFGHGLYKRTLVIQGQGQVLFKKLDIQMPSDIKIDRVLGAEGDVVNIGDTLFTYYDERTMFLARERSVDKQVLRPNNEQINWYHREKNSVQEKIGLLQIKIEELEQEVDDLSANEEVLEQEVLLDIKSRDDLRKEQILLKRRKNELEGARRELVYYHDYSNNLKVPNPYAEKVKYLSAESSSPLYAYVSPVSGTITKVNKENFEVALESQIIMSIHKPENLYIKAFYPQKVLKDLQEGDVVKVKFPDGTKSVGKIIRFYFATYLLPEEFQNQYQPTTRSIAADIVPIEQGDLEKWKAYYKLNVDISKHRISIL